MVKLLRGMALTVVLLTLAACAASAPAGRTARAGVGQPGAPQSVDVGGVTLEVLPAQDLSSGQCGLFLWAGSAPQQPVFTFAAFDTPAEARIRVDGRTRSLRRTDAQGPVRYGQAERQTFSDGRLTIVVSVAFDGSRALADGAAIQSGAMRITGADGWETITPVGGMAACQR